ncbi:WD40 repeat domain-containing protein [Streptomyces sp. NPDC005474]|uniref:WD40 repeat domain-containing protein n=1 Tax=Streptomyces sp. NPDC005474 TaxID=3154878 RepID=UPI003451DA77
MTPPGGPPRRLGGEPPVRSEEIPQGEEIRLQANASDRARIYQARRDMFVAERDLILNFEDGVRSARKVLTASASEECPYPGLAAFGTDQAQWFFGRDKLVAKLLVHLDACLAVGGALVVVAPSGAGKSSLLRAGLLAELKRGALPGSTQWPRVWLTPTSQPMAALRGHLWEIMGSGPDGSPVLQTDALRRILARGPTERRVIVIVDQLEELFTLCPDKQERRDFLDAVLSIADPGPDSEPPLGLVVFGLRSDFYSQCATHPGLLDAVERNQVVVGPLSQEGVREAILYPARAVGLNVQPGLVQVLLRDLGTTEGGAHGTGAYEIGRLPLLAHALRATWLRRAGHVLTVDGYEATGGIANSVTAEADRWFDRLEPPAQETARSVFLRLVKFGERGARDTRRPMPYDELLSHCARPEEAAQVVERFTRGRLLTREQDTVTITHEILLRAWSHLRQWIRDHRVRYLTRQRLEDAAAAWQEAGRDTGMLYRGGRLEEARAMAAGDGGDDSGERGGLGSVASEFLAVSVRHWRRSRRIRHGVIACLSVLAVLAALSAVVAVLQSGAAKHERSAKIQGVVRVNAAQLRTTDASLAAQLDLVAHGIKPDESTEVDLLSAQNLPLSTVLTGHQGEVNVVDFSPDGRVLASADDNGVIRLWSTARQGHTAALGDPLQGFKKRVFGLVFSPRGHFLAAGGEDDTIRFWDVHDPRHPTDLGRPVNVSGGGVNQLAISPDGHTLAAGGADGRIRIWDVAEPRAPKSLPTPLTGADAGQSVFSVAFSPDSRLLASGGSDGSVRLWRVADPKHPSAVRRLPDRISSSGSPISANWVDFSADSRTLAAAGDDSRAHLWDVTNPDKPAPISPLSGNGGVQTVAFSPSRDLMAYGDYDASIWLARVKSPKTAQDVTPPLMGHIGHVLALAFDPTGTRMASAGTDHTVRLWTIPRTLLTGHGRSVSALALSQDGHLLASAGWDNTARLWDVSAPDDPRRLNGSIPGVMPYVGAIAFEPGGKLLAVVARHEVQLWDVTDPETPRHPGSAPRASTDFRSVAFTPDGNTLVGGKLNGTVTLWNVSDPSTPKAVADLDTGTDDSIDRVAVSPDGHTLAAASDAGRAHLWNIDDPTRAKALGKPLQASQESLVSVAFTPDSRTLATSGEDAKIRLWDLADPARPKQLGKDLTDQTGTVNDLAFSRDGRSLISGGNSALRLWDVPQDPARVQPHGGPVTGLLDYVNAIALSPDGSVLFIANNDSTIRVLPLSAEKAIDYVCQATGNLLTPELWRTYVPHLPYDPPCADN